MIAQPLSSRHTNLTFLLLIIGIHGVLGMIAHVDWLADHSTASWRWALFLA